MGETGHSSTAIPRVGRGGPARLWAAIFLTYAVGNGAYLLAGASGPLAVLAFAGGFLLVRSIRRALGPLWRQLATDAMDAVVVSSDMVVARVDRNPLAPRAEVRHVLDVVVLVLVGAAAYATEGPRSLLTTGAWILFGGITATTAIAGMLWSALTRRGRDLRRGRQP